MSPNLATEAASAGDAVDLDLLFADGLGVRSDGTLVRWLELEPINPWVVDESERDRISAVLSKVMQRLPAGQSVTFIVEASPVRVAEVSATSRARAVAAIRHCAHDRQQAYGLARLQQMFEENVDHLGRSEAALEYRYLLVVSHRPASPLFRRRPDRIPERIHERNRAAVDQRTAAMQQSLRGLRIPTRPLAGAEVAEALWAAWNPSSSDTARLRLGELTPRVLAAQAPDSAAAALRAARELRDTIAGSGYLDDGATLVVERDRHLTLAIDRRPTHTSLGWLLPALGTGRPFRLAVHVTARDQDRMRRSIRTQYAMARASGRDDSRQGRLEDFDNSSLEAEVYGLNQRLADPTQPLRFYDASIYLTVRQPDGADAESEPLLEVGRALRDDFADRAGAGVTLGDRDQLELFRSATPLGIDHAGYTEPYTSDVVGQLLPVLGSRCDSPGGVPMFLLGDRSLGRWDPLDPDAMNWLLTVVGAAGSGKTFVLQELARALLRNGMPGFVIDHADHFAALASAVDGAYVALGEGANRCILNPWDVPDVAHVDAEKLTFLLDLHAALVGNPQSPDDLGLSKTEQSLLRRAFRRVYVEAAADPSRPPCESRLRDVLADEAEQEAAAGAGERAALLRDLHDRVAGFCGEEPDAWLVDRPTTLAPRAPLVVFNTSSVGDSLAAAVMLVITEYVQRFAHDQRAARADLQDLDEDTRRQLAWSGYCFLISDETWAAMTRAATGRAINTFARKSRHLGVVFMAATQRLADFDNEWGRALLSSATQRMFLKQNPNDFEVLRSIAGLSEHVIRLIEEHVQTQPGHESRGFWINGTRGSGLFALRVSARCYWASTTNPRDVPLRDHAITEAVGDFWGGVDRLVSDGTRPLSA